VLLVNDPARAEALAAEVRTAGYDVRIDTHDGGWTWIVAAAGTEADAAWFGAAAARHGAEYEGSEPWAP
jgi:hypothetical protein